MLTCVFFEMVPQGCLGTDEGGRQISHAVRMEKRKENASADLENPKSGALRALYFFRPRPRATRGGPMRRLAPTKTDRFLFPGSAEVFIQHTSARKGLLQDRASGPDSQGLRNVHLHLWVFCGCVFGSLAVSC